MNMKLPIYRSHWLIGIFTSYARCISNVMFVVLDKTIFKNLDLFEMFDSFTEVFLEFQEFFYHCRLGTMHRKVNNIMNYPPEEVSLLISFKTS